MPYTIKKQGDKYCVYKTTGGSSLGCHPTRKKAAAQIAAIEASERKRKKK